MDFSQYSDDQLYTIYLEHETYRTTGVVGENSIIRDICLNNNIADTALNLNFVIIHAFHEVSRRYFGG